MKNELGKLFILYEGLSTLTVPMRSLKEAEKFVERQRLLADDIMEWKYEEGKDG